MQNTPFHMVFTTSLVVNLSEIQNWQTISKMQVIKIKFYKLIQNITVIFTPNLKSKCFIKVLLFFQLLKDMFSDALLPLNRSCLLDLSLFRLVSQVLSHSFGKLSSDILKKVTLSHITLDKKSHTALPG